MTAPANRKRNGLVVTAAAVFAVVFVGMTCLFQIRVTEQAMVSTLGKPGAPLTKPGLYWKAPWPFQRVYVFDRRVQLFEGTHREVLTKDGLNLIVRFYLAWAIEDPNLFYEWVGFRTEEGGKILSGLLDKHSSDVIGQRSLASFVSTRPDQEQAIAGIEEDIQKRIADEARKYGIGIRALGLEHLGLPESITAAVFERMIADRERLTEKTRAEADRDAKLIRTEANQIRDEKLSDAEAKAVRIRGEGESEALKHFSVFDEDPEFALFLRKLEALEETLRDKTTIILDRDTPPYDLLKADGLQTTDGSRPPKALPEKK